MRVRSLSFVLQNFLLLSRLIEPEHQRYCWVWKALSVSGHRPVDSAIGTLRRSLRPCAAGRPGPSDRRAPAPPRLRARSSSADRAPESTAGTEQLQSSDRSPYTEAVRRADQGGGRNRRRG